MSKPKSWTPRPRCPPTPLRSGVPVGRVPGTSVLPAALGAPHRTLLTWAAGWEALPLAMRNWVGAGLPVRRVKRQQPLSRTGGDSLRPWLQTGSCCTPGPRSPIFCISGTRDHCTQVRGRPSGVPLCTMSPQHPPSLQDGWSAQQGAVSTGSGLRPGYRKWGSRESLDQRMP